MSHREILDLELEKFKIQLDEAQKVALTAYCDNLAHWNETINLTALAGGALVRRLVAEPVWISHEVGLEGSLVDIGSGNGSPAIPFTIARPIRTCHLVEARAKRAAFLRHVVAAQKLPNTIVHRARFEEAVVTLESPNWISLQAVALTEKLIHAVHRIASATTTIVWITSGTTAAPFNPFRRITVPITGTQVLLFRLDLP